jgi:hypothetical protein
MAFPGFARINGSLRIHILIKRRHTTVSEQRPTLSRFIFKLYSFQAEHKISTRGMRKKLIQTIALLTLK